MRVSPTNPAGRFSYGNSSRAPRPVLLSLVYYQCPMLCNMVLNGETAYDARDEARAGPRLRRGDHQLRSEGEDGPWPPQRRRPMSRNLESRARPTHGIFSPVTRRTFDRLPQSVGFRYRWDDTTKQWAHASGIIVVTPDARISRYLYGVDFQPRDLRLALVEASKNKIGRLTDQILLLCYHYDPAQGKYTVAVFKTMRVAGTATLAAARRIRVHQPASGQALESLICTSEFSRDGVHVRRGARSVVLVHHGRHRDHDHRDLRRRRVVRAEVPPAPPGGAAAH